MNKIIFKSIMAIAIGVGGGVGLTDRAHAEDIPTSRPLPPKVVELLRKHPQVKLLRDRNRRDQFYVVPNRIKLTSQSIKLSRDLKGDACDKITRRIEIEKKIADLQSRKLDLNAARFESIMSPLNLINTWISSNVTDVDHEKFEATLEKYRKLIVDANKPDSDLNTKMNDIEISINNSNSWLISNKQTELEYTAMYEAVFQFPTIDEIREMIGFDGVGRLSYPSLIGLKLGPIGQFLTGNNSPSEDLSKIIIKTGRYSGSWSESSFGEGTMKNEGAKSEIPEGKVFFQRPLTLSDYCGVKNLDLKSAQAEPFSIVTSVSVWKDLNSCGKVGDPILDFECKINGDLMKHLDSAVEETQTVISDDDGDPNRFSKIPDGKSETESNTVTIEFGELK